MVGAAGVSYEELDVQLGAGKYSSDLQVLPALGHILREPNRARCEVTGQMVPDAWLESCSVSGKVALRHFFGTSAFDARQKWTSSACEK